MMIYAVMVTTRYVNPEPFLFSTADAAITYARAEAQRGADQPEDFQEQRTPPGWLYYATYSTEGDAVWVLAKELDGGDR